MGNAELRLIDSNKDLHPKVQRAMDNIMHCIIDMVVRYRGQISVSQIEKLTGLKSIGVYITADILKYMAKQGLIEIRGGYIWGSVAKLTEIKEQAKTNLPLKHNKLWEEDDYVVLCEKMIAKENVDEIAKSMNRTTKSVRKQATALRKAYKLIPIIERHSVVRSFASKQKSPNPKE